MTALNHKLLRDAWHLRGQLTAIGLVIGCGIGTFVMSLSTLESLELTQATYYEQYRFAHVFAQLKRAPAALAPRLAEIAGMAEVQTRVVADVTLDVPGLDEPAIGRLISIPDRRPPTINRLHLRLGRWPETERGGEVLASEGFCQAHGFQPGDRLHAVIKGRRETLVIVGVALSPEYVYQIRGGEVFPNDRTFGVFWMSETELANAFDMQGAFNDLACYLQPGASEPAVLEDIDRVIGEYGGLGAYGRGDQVSNRYVTNEIRELRNMGLFAPIIFLVVAAFLLNMVLSRIVGTQREQIAALKAFGYTRGEIGLHYIKLVALVVVAGVALGTGLGVYQGRWLTEMYTVYFRFPVLAYRLTPDVVLWALAVSSVAAGLGTLGAVRRAARLPPAAAMQPEPPAAYRRTLLERWGLGAMVSPATRMILRHLQRRPVPAALSVLGIAMAVSILVLGNSIGDELDDLMEFEFYKLHRQDVTVVLVEPSSGRTLHDIARLDGVLRVEPLRSAPVRLRSANHRRRVEIMGIKPGGELFRVLDRGAAELPLPSGGIVLNAELAELLEVAEGDTLSVEVLEGERPVRRVPVTAVVHDLVGTSAYMDLRSLHRLLREGDSVSGAFLAVDERAAARLYSRLKATPRVAAVTVKLAAKRSLQETLAENLLRMKAVNIVFAAIIAFGVVYNSARIAVSERSRDLASLRVLGFTRAEISYILLGELTLLTLAAIPPGEALGYALARLTSWGYDTEMFRVPFVVLPSTYALAASVVIAAAILSGLVVRRRLDHLDLVAVLKTKE